MAPSACTTFACSDSKAVRARRAFKKQGEVRSGRLSPVLDSKTWARGRKPALSPSNPTLEPIAEHPEKLVQCQIRQ